MFTYIGCQLILIGIAYKHLRYLVSGILMLCSVSILLVSLYSSLSYVNSKLHIMSILYGKHEAYGKMFTRYIKKNHFTVKYWIVRIALIVSALSLIICNYNPINYMYYQNIYVLNQTEDYSRLLAERVGILLPTCLKMTGIESNTWIIFMFTCFLIGVFQLLIAIPWDILYGIYWHKKWHDTVVISKS